jgi:pilus assembly protein CpaC
VVCLVFVLSWAWAPAWAAESEEYNLVVGGQMSFPADGIQNYSVSNPKLLQVAVSSDGRALVAKALKPGTVTLLLIHENKSEPDRTVTFNIFARNPKAVLAELNEILRNYPDVQARQNGPQIVLQGSVQTPQEESRLKDLERNYGGQVLSLVTVGPSGARRNVMVRLDLHYVQVRKRVARQFGLSYPYTIGRPSRSSGGGGGSSSGGNGGAAQNTGFAFSFDFLNGAVTTAQYSLVTDVLPALDIGESAGYVKLLRTDTIVTENGTAAVYKDGTEFNFALSGGVGGSGKSEKIFFGSELRVVPRLSAGNDAISLDIRAELTQRDDAPGSVSSNLVTQLPNRLLDSVETSVHLPIGQSIMISGVKSKFKSRTTSGLPWLNRLPIIGYLFGSEAYASEDVEGVLFITPTLLQSTSPENRRRIDDALKHFEQTVWW